MRVPDNLERALTAPVQFLSLAAVGSWAKTLPPMPLMEAFSVVVSDEFAKKMWQVCFAEDEDVIRTV